jgi:predicted ribosomally synthesized peptide with SipW-like signal peptide
MTWVIFGLISVFVVAGVTATLVVRRRAPRRRHRVSALKRLVATISGVLVGIVLAVSGAGVTYAYLNAQTTVGGATLRAGTLGLTVSNVDATAFTALLPGETVQRDITVTSTGDAKAAVTVKRTAAGPLVVSIASVACANVTGSTSWTTITTSAASIGDFTAGQARTYCLRGSAPTSGLAENASTGFTLDFVSTQKAP